LKTTFYFLSISENKKIEIPLQKINSKMLRKILIKKKSFFALSSFKPAWAMMVDGRG